MLNRQTRAHEGTLPALLLTATRRVAAKAVLPATAILLALSATAAMAQDLRQEHLQAKLEMVYVAPAGDVAKIRFKLKNQHAQALNVLARGTPFEGFLGKIFTVVCDGSEIPYHGPIVKREPQPDPNEYVLLQPGEERAAVVDLAKVYDLGRGGSCTVEWQGRIFDVGLEKTEDLYKRTQLRGLETPANKVSFSIAAGSVSYTGCNSGEQSKLQTALSNGGNLAGSSKTYLDNVPSGNRPTDSRYKKWFGAYTSGRYGTATGTYGQISTAASGSLTFDCTGSGSCGSPFTCQSSYYAVTCSGGAGKTIWLCPAFWRAAATGLDSQAGTVVHELSHWYGTSDYAYGCSNAANLASTDPGKAVANGDSYEYFAENACP